MNQLLTEEKTRFPACDIVGTKVTALGFNEAVAAILGWARKKERRFVCVANVHMVIEAHRNPDLADILSRADLVTADGMPLVWAMRRRGFASAERVYGPDLAIKLYQLAGEADIPVYFFGSSTTTINALKASIAKQFPLLNAVAFEAPPTLPLRPCADKAIIDRINASGARIIFVGLGCPKQEYWMAAHSPHIPAVLIGVGAAFDFFAATKRQAPPWMRRSGLEWLFRLLTEPRRLWRRYLTTNLMFTWYIVLESLGFKRSPV